jgi:hypothetical protein
MNTEVIQQAREHIKDLPNREARLVRIEEAVKSTRGWAIIAAFVGGLLGRAAPDMVDMITKAAFAQTETNKVIEKSLKNVVDEVAKQAVKIEDALPAGLL